VIRETSLDSAFPDNDMRSKQNRPTCTISRHRRTGIIVLCSLAAALLIWLDHSPIRRRWQARPRSKERAKADDLEEYHAKTFAVVNVIDGDTIDIDIADGEHRSTRIRLLGIDAPEVRSAEYGTMYFGPQAARFTQESALGKAVTVYLDVPNPIRDKYGRLLAYVQLPDRSLLNNVLLSEGLAYADLRFRHSLYHKYQQLQAAARSQKRGLWKQVTREQLPEWLRSERPNLLKGK